MSSFALPNIDILRAATYDFNTHRKAIRQKLIRRINNDPVSSMYTDDSLFNELIPHVASYLTQKCVINHPRSTDEYLIQIVYPVNNRNILSDDYVMVRLSDDINTFIQIMSRFCIINLLSNGLNTESWQPIDDILFRYLGNSHDQYRAIPLHRSHEIGDIIDQLFDEDRNEVINQTYSTTQHHEIELTNESAEMNDDIKECHLCYDNAQFICYKCAYPMCKSCLEHLQKSTGICPCCRSTPLKLKSINGALSQKYTDNHDTTNSGVNNSNSTPINPDDMSQITDEMIQMELDAMIRAGFNPTNDDEDEFPYNVRVMYADRTPVANSNNIEAIREMIRMMLYLSSTT